MTLPYEKMILFRNSIVLKSRTQCRRVNCLFPLLRYLGLTGGLPVCQSFTTSVWNLGHGEGLSCLRIENGNNISYFPYGRPVNFLQERKGTRISFDMGFVVRV